MCGVLNKLLAVVAVGAATLAGAWAGEIGATQTLPTLASVAAQAIAQQTDPAKLATLKGSRAANPRLQRCIYWLAKWEGAGADPGDVLTQAARINGTSGTPRAEFLRWGLLENLRLAKEMGILGEDGLEELRRGKSAAITRGDCVGQEAQADHVLPLALCPELGNEVFNLELLPAKLNQSKGMKVGERQKIFARELYEAKLLSLESFQRVEKAAEEKIKK